MEKGSFSASDWIDASSGFKEHEKSLECCERALSLEPENALAWRKKAELLLELGKKNTAALCYHKAVVFYGEMIEKLKHGDASAFEKSTKIPKKHIKKYVFEKLIHSILSQGDCYYNLDMYDDAIKSYDAVLQLDPDNFDAILWQGHAYCVKSNFEAALKRYEHYLKYLPDSYETLFDVSYIHYIFDDKQKASQYWYKTIDCCDKMIAETNSKMKSFRIHPRDIKKDLEILKTKTLSLYFLALYEKTISCLDQILKLDPENRWAWYGKAVIYDILNLSKQAQNCYQKDHELSKTKKMDYEFALN